MGDMVCVNQKDMRERSEQVLLLGEIFSKAIRVVAWLGPRTKGSAVAIRCIKLPHDSRTHSESAIFETEQLLDRTFFRRMWIIQELAKARSVEFWCGPDTMTMDELNVFVKVRDSMNHTPAAWWSRLHAIQQFRSRERQSKIGIPRMLLSQALISTRSSDATDPRHHIYALLGLTLDGRDVVPTPNYMEDVATVYAAASRYMINTEGLTSLIVLARGTDCSNRASWEPDWSSHSTFPPWIGACVAQQRETLDFQSEVLGNVLSVRGCRLGEICQWTFGGVESMTESIAVDIVHALTATLAHSDRGNQTSSTMKPGVKWASTLIDMLSCPATYPLLTILLQQHSDITPEVTGSSDQRVANRPGSHLETLSDLIEHAASLMLNSTSRFVALAQTGSLFGAIFRSMAMSGLQIAHQDARTGDQIWRLENCRLPVLLRPLKTSNVTFVSGLLEPSHEQLRVSDRPHAHFEPYFRMVCIE